MQDRLKLSSSLGLTINSSLVQILKLRHAPLFLRMLIFWMTDKIIKETTEEETSP